jgi:hypothetical protein
MGQLRTIAATERRLSERADHQDRPHWEYRKIILGEFLGNREVDALNDAGKEGWELVGISANSVAYLKRQVPTKSAMSLKRKAVAAG